MSVSVIRTSMDTRHSFGKGALIGFLFGTVGLWIIAALSLAIPYVELAARIFLLPGRYVAGLLFESSIATWGVVLLFLFNGLLYATIGALIHITINAVRK